jgi:hypothetical protein
MSDQVRAAAIEAIAKALAPFVKLMLDVGIGSKEAEDLLRTVYVNTAASALEGILGSKPPAAIVALRCGLPRKDVTRRLKQQSLGDNRYAMKVLFNRVLSGWRQDERYLDKHGVPLELKLEGRASFQTLCENYAPDYHPRNVLEELKRVGAVEQSAANRVRVLAETYVAEDVGVESLRELGTHARMVLESMRADLKGAGQPPNVWAQLGLNIDARHLPRLRRNLRERIESLISSADGQLNDPAARATARSEAGTSLGLIIALVGATENQLAVPQAQDAVPKQAIEPTPMEPPLASESSRLRMKAPQKPVVRAKRGSR